MLRAARRICEIAGVVSRTTPWANPAAALALCRRQSSLSPEEVQATIDKINDKFVEARDEIEFAAEDAETTYFNDSYESAKSLVEEVVGEFNTLLESLPDEEKGRLQRSMGMKMEQLKAELTQLDSLHAD